VVKVTNIHLLANMSQQRFPGFFSPVDQCGVAQLTHKILYLFLEGPHISG